jgi:hypothetical protein
VRSSKAIQVALRAVLLVAAAAGGAQARVDAMIVKDRGRVVVSVHDGERLRWWNTAEPIAAARFQLLKQEHHNCGLRIYEQRMRWTADGRAELLCTHRAWRSDGAELTWWDVPHHQGNFDTGIAPLPGHRIGYCESPTPHGGTSPYCAQYKDTGTYYAEICRDGKCRDRYLGGSFAYHHYLRGSRVLLAVERLQLTDARTGRRLHDVGDATVHDYEAIVSPDETLVMTADREGWNGRAPARATLWNLRDGRRYRRIPGSAAWGGFSPDGRHLTVFAGTEVRTFRLRPFRLVAAVRRPVPVTAVAWSDDSRSLFVGDEKDGIERIDTLPLR